jgi:hypothetical protein
MKFVDRHRHIEGIKGIVRINENEYQSNLAIQESKLASILLCSLWKTAFPGEQLIKEIEIEGGEDNRSKGSRKTIQLWTNQDQNQYAIRLEGKSDLLATTNQNT